MLRTGMAAVGAVLLLGACGSDDTTADTTADTKADSAASSAVDTTVGSSATGASGSDDLVGEVVDFTVSQGQVFGYEVDVDCVRGLVEQLSEDDLAAIAESNAAGTEPELSAEGEALGEQVETCVLSEGADPALVEQAFAKLLSEGSEGLDTECVETNLAMLTNAQLQAVIDAETDSTDPVALAAAGVLFDCIELTGDSGSGSVDGLTYDVCGSLDLAVLAPLGLELEAGEPLSSGGVFGTGVSCKYPAGDIENVTVTVTENADIAAWTAETSNGDGFNDGEEIPGIGDHAVAGLGSVTAAVGTTLVELRVFPSDLTDEAGRIATLTALLPELGL